MDIKLLHCNNKGAIKGLADLNDDSSKDMAVNKGYLDNKLSEIDANRPFNYYSGSEKVVKGQDGKFINQKS